MQVAMLLERKALVSAMHPWYGWQLKLLKKASTKC